MLENIPTNIGKKGEDFFVCFYGISVASVVALIFTLFFRCG